MRKEDMRIKRTRKMLLESMFDLMQTKSFDKLTVNEICEHAMVHRATFYNHFRDKNDLLNYGIDELQERMFESAVNQEYDNPKQMYLNLIANFLDFLDKNKKSFQLILKNSHEKIVSMSCNTVKQSIRYLHGKNKDEQNYSLPFEVVLNFLAGGVTSVFLGQLESDKPYSKDDLMKFFEILMNEKNLHEQKK